VTFNRKSFPSGVTGSGPTQSRVISSQGCEGKGNVVWGAGGWAADLSSWQWRQDRI
jgi:hypothetical protein